MKTCSTCPKLIKNGYTHCYECNGKQETPSTSSDTEQSYKKENIPRVVKNSLWIIAFKDSRVGVCQCCRREPITINNFHSGHVIAEKNGGSTTLDNMRCICPFCNISMKTQNMDTFIAKYNLHYGL
jgi:hypothetical protein